MYIQLDQQCIIHVHTYISPISGLSSQSPGVIDRNFLSMADQIYDPPHGTSRCGPLSAFVVELSMYGKRCKYPVLTQFMVVSLQIASNVFIVASL